MDVKDKKPAVLKGIAWGTFSGTATASAFLLPAFIMGQFLYGRNFTAGLPPWLFYGTTALILFCALYHSIYRIIASNHDLKLIKTVVQYILILFLITFLLPFIDPFQLP